MFTGLIEDMGSVQRLETGGRQTQLSVQTGLRMDEIALGDSVAVNGVCLTVVRRSGGVFTVDVSPETLQSSTLGQLRPGSRVNLERALRLGDRLGGHIVSGHVDALATVRDRAVDGNAVRFRFQMDPAACRYLVHKGSVAIEGVSLTVNQADHDSFTVAMIPHSLEQTTLQWLQPGDRVNIETDILAKYVERLLPAQGNRLASGDGESRVTSELLARHGFL